MSSPTTIKVIGDQVDHTQPVQSEEAAAATSEVTFLNTIDETDPKGIRAQKRHSKLNHPKRRRRLQKKVPDPHHLYKPVWLPEEQRYFDDPAFPQGCGHQSLDTYDLPKSYLQGPGYPNGPGGYRHYDGFTWIHGEFGPRKRKWGSKRYTTNFFCANVFGSGSKCKHTEKHMRMRDIRDEVDQMN